MDGGPEQSATQVQVYPDSEDGCKGNNGFYFNGHVDPGSVRVDEMGNVWATVDSVPNQCSGVGCTATRNDASVTVSAAPASAPLEAFWGNVGTISAYHPMDQTCVWQGVTAMLIDLSPAGWMPHANVNDWTWSSDKMGFMYTPLEEATSATEIAATTTDVVDKGAGFVKSTPRLESGVRTLLRNQGYKISMKHISKDATKIGEHAGRLAKVLAVYEGIKQYKQCEGN